MNAMTYHMCMLYMSMCVSPWINSTTIYRGPTEVRHYVNPWEIPIGDKTPQWSFTPQDIQRLVSVPRKYSSHHSL